MLGLITSVWVTIGGHLKNRLKHKCKEEKSEFTFELQKQNSQLTRLTWNFAFKLIMFSAKHDIKSFSQFGYKQLLFPPNFVQFLQSFAGV